LWYWKDEDNGKEKENRKMTRNRYVSRRRRRGAFVVEAEAEALGWSSHGLRDGCKVVLEVGRRGSCPFTLHNNSRRL
jgi:hypothetical protein